MRALAKSFRWKRVLLAYGVLWLILAGVAYALCPWAPTGNRILDAGVASAAAAAVLMELLDLLGILWTFPRILAGGGAGDRDAG